MPSHREAPFAVAVLSILLATSAAAALAAAVPPEAPAGPASEDDSPRWHIVRPGETLEKIARLLLGSTERWPEIWRLNHEIANPHRISPGQRVRIPLLLRGTPAATLRRLSHEVTERPAPNPWSPAQLGDTLIERDAVRTFAKSSAEMSFNDGTRLLVTEDSLVFLERSRGALAGVESKAVEIVEGQADYQARPAARRPADVEIVLGAARLTSRPDRDGAAEARARRPQGGGSKVMVYGGDGEVEAAGAKVMVPEGSGTSVGRDGPPSPPEKLLPAPRQQSPAAGAELAFANPIFLWDRVPAAEAYVVELCRDAGCAVLLDRRLVVAAPGAIGSQAGSAAGPPAGSADGPEAEWSPPAALAPGELFWRVTARSASGLDGYPSAGRRLAILSDRVDREPPIARLALDGPHIQVGETLFAAPAIRVAATAEDAGCGVARLDSTIDDRPAAAGPLAPGPHRAGGVALDRCGNRAALAPLAFVVDAAPPIIHWEIGGVPLFAAHGEARAPLRPPRRRESGRRRQERASADGTVPALDWTADGRGWSELLGERAGAPVYHAIRIASDRPQIFVAASGLRLAAAGEPLAIGPDQVLWIAAEDAGSGVDHLSFRTRAAAAPGGPAVLEIDAVDLVGNARHLELTLSR